MRSGKLTRVDYYTVCLHALDKYLASIDRGENVAMTRESVSETRQVMEAMRNNAISDGYAGQVEHFD